MSNMARIAWINEELSAGRALTAKKIAEKFEVTEKTAKRDIEYMRDQCMAPIVWNAGKRSYEYEHRWNGLEFVDEHSLLAFAFVRAILGQFCYIPVVANNLEHTFMAQIPDAYRKIVENIEYQLPQMEPIPDALVYEICRSISTQRRLVITYENSSRELTVREFEPRKLLNYSGKWYAVGYDHLKKDLRTFLLARILSYNRTDIQFLNEDETGITREKIDSFIRDSYGIFKGDPVGTAVLRFTGGAANSIRNTIWHPDQIMREIDDPEKDRSIELALPVHDYPELLGRALRCGSSCEVLSPPEFRSLWLEEIRKMKDFLPEEKLDLLNLTERIMAKGKIEARERPLVESIMTPDGLLTIHRPFLPEKNSEKNNQTIQ